MASGIYTRFKANLMNKVVNLGVDTINVALYDDTAVFTATDTDYNSANELATAGGYTQGGAALAGMVVDDSTATVKWDANDLSWTSATFSAYKAAIYDVTATNDLICFIDFGGVKTVTAGTFTLQWDAAGIITLS